MELATEPHGRVSKALLEGVRRKATLAVDPAVIANCRIDGPCDRKDPVRPSLVNPDRDPDLGVDFDLTPDLGGERANGALGQAIAVSRCNVELPEARAVGRLKEPQPLSDRRQMMQGCAAEDPTFADEGVERKRETSRHQSAPASVLSTAVIGVSLMAVLVQLCINEKPVPKRLKKVKNKSAHAIKKTEQNEVPKQPISHRSQK